MNMTCECGGVLLVISVEEYPENLKDKINYDRLCKRKINISKLEMFIFFLADG
jgi:hypothetical protein